LGAWGTAIFSDDLASDIRGDWRDLIGDGMTPEAATQRILSDYAASLNDPDESSVVWLALALTQWKTGRLLDDVGRTAIDVIDRGADLHRWETPQLRSAREKVLAKTRSQLLSPQPEARKLPKRRRSETPFAPGDVVRYSHSEGCNFLFWVTRNQTDKGGEYSQVECLDFVGDDPPTLDKAIRLPAMERRYVPRSDGSVHEPDRLGFVLLHASSIPDDRIAVLGNRPRPARRPTHSLIVVDVKQLEDILVPFLPGGDHIPRRQRTK